MLLLHDCRDRRKNCQCEFGEFPCALLLSAVSLPTKDGINMFMKCAAVQECSPVGESECAVGRPLAS